MMKPTLKPYWAVIFSSQKNSSSDTAYEKTAQRMMELAVKQPGFIGVESVRNADGSGITVSYWESPEAIRTWKEHPEHLEAQRRGRTEWYSQFKTRICRVEREYPLLQSSTPDKFPILETERLWLKLRTDCEPRAILEHFTRNREHFAFTDPPVPENFYTEAYWRTQIQNCSREWLEGTSARFVLVPKHAPEKVIGTANLTQISRGPFLACYLGYGIGGESQGQGLMYEALREITRFAFEELELHRIMANHLPENARSAALLKRLGFQVEGLAKNYLFIRGQWQDHVLNSLTNPSPVTPG